MSKQFYGPTDPLPVPLHMRAGVPAIKIQKPRPPEETLEVACRAWWEAPGPDGKRIATCSWDEFVARAQRENAPPQYQQSVNDYRLRMMAALVAAIGWP